MILPVIDENGNVVHLNVHDICCIEKDSKTRKVIIHTAESHYFMPSTVEEINDCLSPFGYMQIDRNRVVNLNKVDRFERGKVYLCGYAHDVSKRKRDAVEAAIIENRSRNTKFH